MNVRQALHLSIGGLWAAAGMSLAAISLAETVEVPVGQQGQQQQTIVRPSAGMKQSEVEARFGEPIGWTDAIGDPPISSWIYPDFVVYFEYDQVLHSVVKHTPQPDSSAD